MNVALIIKEHALIIRVYSYDRIVLIPRSSTVPYNTVQQSTAGPTLLNNNSNLLCKPD